MGSEPEDKLELEAALKALRREAVLSNVRGTSLVLALLSIPLWLEGFSAALASDDTRLRTFVMYLGGWPFLLLPARWLEYIGHYSFFGLYFGFPMIAWALI
jgi:hypothetical protein